MRHFLPPLVSTALIAQLTFAPAFAATQPTAPTKPRTTNETKAANGPTHLPVTRVSLYKNGVGFFEHSGHVTGDQSVTIDFTTAQLNDVLQSLTAIDLNGGRISGAGYNSTTPLDQQLKSLALGLPENTTFSGLFTALHGARVEVHGTGAAFTGRIVDIEMHKAGPGKDESAMTEGHILTVASDAGEIRIFQITPTLSVRLLDTDAHTDLNQYLQLLDSTRNQGLRHLTLEDRGTGTRELHLSYISEVPVWKSTYRIFFTDAANSSHAKQTATLQGWSVVDNTTGVDWNNVQLSLIAGAPQSFIQPLSTPYYARRPEIPLPQAAQLTPQTHESGEEAKTPPPPQAAPMSNRFSGGGLAQGYGSGMAGGVMGGVSADRAASALMVRSRDIDALSNNSGGIMYQAAAAASLAPNTTTSAFDDFFEYKLADPITIRKNESALVPILQSKIDATRVTIVSYRNGSVSQPLRALWITNTTGLTLDRGSFTLVENGNFAGEGLLDPIHPSEKRLLSYAADQSVHVSTEGDKTTNRITLLRGSRGVLNIHRADVHEVTFVLHNAAADRRTVVTEVPVVAGWALDSDPTPEETTPTLYRFRTELDPGQTVRLHVGGKRTGYTTYNLTNANDQQLEFFLNETSHNPALETALQPILEARRRVADAQAAVDAVNQRLTALHADEERQRANITALKDADKSARQRFVDELNQSEDQIAQQQKELATRDTALKTAQQDLANKIESLQIDETLN